MEKTHDKAMKILGVGLKPNLELTVNTNFGWGVIWYMLFDGILSVSSLQTALVVVRVLRLAENTRLMTDSFIVADAKSLFQLILFLTASPARAV